MSRRRATVSSGIVLSLVIIGGLSWSLLGWQGKPNTAPDLLLPAKPVLLYTWDGFESHKAAWEATAAKKALVDSGLAKTIGKLIDFAVAESGEPGAKLAQRIVTRAYERGASLAVAVANVENMPAPQATLLLHGSADFEPELNSLLLEGPLKSVNPTQETVAGRKVTRVTLPDSPGYEVGWWTDGGHFVITFGGNAVAAAIEITDGKAPNLSTNATVKALRTAKDFDVASVSLLDLKALLALVEKLEIPPIPDSGKGPVKVSDVLKVLGLDRVGTLQGRWGFRGDALWSEATLDAPAPRTGLLSLLDQSAFGLSDLPPLPKGCDNFSAFKFHFSKFSTTVIKLLDKGIEAFSPNGTPSATQFLGRVKERHGLDPVADLLDHFGDTVVGFVDPSSSGFMPAVGLMIEVDEAEKLLATLAKLKEQAVQLSGENAKFRTKELNGRTIHIVQLAGPLAIFSPSWVIDKGWLVIGATPQSVEAHVKRVDGKLPKWEAPPEIAAAQQLLPQKFVSFGYSDPRPGIRSLLSLAPTGISLAEIGMVEWRKEREKSGKPVDDSVEFPISAEDVPVSEEVIGPLFPNLNVATVDDKGVKWYSRSSLPGLPIPGSGGGGIEGVGVVAVLVALLLPAVQQAREAARRSQSKNNLKQLALALHNYHDTKGSFPAATYPNPKLKPEERLSWIVGLLPFLDEASRFDKLKLQKAWDDEANAESTKARLPILLNPSQSGVTEIDGVGVSHYVAIAGVSKDAPTLPITDKRVGYFGYDRKTKISDVTDGTSNTIMVTDAAMDFGPWARGGAATLRSLTTKPYVDGPDGIGSPHVGIFNVMLGDGAVRAVSKDIDPAVLEALVTIHGGEEIGDF